MTIIIIIITIRILRSHALYIRSQTTTPRSTYQRNKRLRRPNLELETLVNLVVRYKPPKSSINALIAPIYSIQLKSRENLKVVKTNQVILLRLSQQIQMTKTKRINLLIPTLLLLKASLPLWIYKPLIYKLLNY